MRRRYALGLITALAIGTAIAAAHPGNRVGYLARAAVGQIDMLWGRVPLDAAIASGDLDPDQAARLALVPSILRWARGQGLAHTDSYQTFHPTWDRTIWNLSACDRLSFRPKRYWFPIVGAITYIGTFDRDQANARAALLGDRGYDTYVRRAGAYSTLGWFADPILPEMLTWSEDRLAETLTHELTHATVWIGGQPTFNESFANFVGEALALRWLAHHHGPDSPEVRRARDADADAATYRALLAGVVAELEAIYGHAAYDDDEVLARKAAVLASLPARAAGAGFRDPDRYRAVFADPGGWNNARLLQFRTYHRGQRAFAALLSAHDGDVASLIDQVRGWTSDPWIALAEASGIDPS